jgi:4,5-DOPA dioxygenase extradiol
MFPEAEIPVIPLSLQTRGGPQQAYRLGLALRHLPAQGFLIIGSGSLTHNLRDYQLAWRNGGHTPAYVRQFTDWFAERLQNEDIAALLDYRQQAPAASQAHPSAEHLLPFYVALGAAGESFWAERLHSGIDDFVIAMDAYSFLPRSGA